MRAAALALLLLLSALHTVSCTGMRSAIRPPASTLAANPTPTLTFVPSPSPFPSATPVNPDTGWLLLRPGMEQRVLNLAGTNGEWLENITILRLDPTAYRFDVAYRPGEPQSLARWQEETGALLVVNAGFFTEANLATGLLVSQGQRHGVSYEGFGGMFAVTQDGPSLRWLVDEPYSPDEPLLAAVQSFPMLLAPGGDPVPTSDDGYRARRTVIAQDGSGRILFLLAARGHFTLYRLSRYLQASDLELHTALNLDGGASSGLLLPQANLFIPALALLPAVIVVHER